MGGRQMEPPCCAGAFGSSLSRADKTTATGGGCHEQRWTVGQTDQLYSNDISSLLLRNTGGCARCDVVSRYYCNGATSTPLPTPEHTTPHTHP